MAIKKVYVNPGDMLIIRVITDPELPKNATEWSDQRHPRQVSLVIHGHEYLTYADPQVHIIYDQKHKLPSDEPKP